MISVAVTKQILDALRGLSTPTVANAIEVFDVRPRNEGFMSPEISCLFPDLGVMVGFAVTARFAADRPSSSAAPRPEFWKYVLGLPEPRAVVMQDLDEPPGIGAYFGEVQSTIHQTLGCAGVVTNGHVRDLDEARSLGFHYFARGVCVSHAYVHLVDFGQPVEVGGIEVRPGDLLHADKHGVLTVPIEIAPDILKAAEQIAVREQKIISACKSSDFSLEKLNEVYKAG